MKKKKQKYIILLQIIIAIILSIMVVIKMKNPVDIDVDFANMQTERLDYTENGWVLKAGAEAVDETKKEYLISSSSINVKPGSYTVHLKYKSNKMHTCEIYSESKKSFVHANRFYLSKNKTDVVYDFYVTANIDDLVVRIVDYDGNGDFSLSAIRMYENSHNLRLILLVWLMLSAGIDFVLFSKWWKKNHSLILTIIGISLVSSIVLFMSGISPGHDFRFHYQRIESIAEGLKNFTFPVKMYSTYNDGYGYPVGVYYGDLLLYIPAILRIWGLSIVTAYKVFVYLINLLTTIIAYWSFEKIFKYKKTAIIITLVYVTSSYRFIDVYVRMAVGEYIALAIFPMIALAVWNIYKMPVTDPKYKKNSILLAAGMLGLLYSHILSVEMTAISLGIIALVFYKKTFRRETLWVYFKAVLIFIILGAAFIVPFLAYYLNVDILLKYPEKSSMQIQAFGAYLSDYFAVFRDYFGNATWAVNTRMQFTPGLLLMAGLFVGCYFIVIKKATKEIKCMTISSAIILFVASNYFPWNQLEEHTKIGKLMVQVQFPWRFIGVATVVLSILAGLVVEKIIDDGYMKKNRMYSSIALISVIMVCMFVSSYEDNTEQVAYIDTAELTRYTDSVYSELGLAATEYVLVGTDMSKLDYEVTGENARADIISEKSVDMTVHVKGTKNSYIDIPRFCYPGYRVYDDEGNHYSTEVGNNNKIRILFENKVNSDIHIDYVEPWYWRLAEVVSLVGVIALLIQKQHLMKKHMNDAQ